MNFKYQSLSTLKLSISIFSLVVCACKCVCVCPKKFLPTPRNRTYFLLDILTFHLSVCDPLQTKFLCMV